MDVEYGSDVANQFITNVGLVTSKDGSGYNIMACEWTHHVSYKPGIIAVSINPNHRTHDTIFQYKEFGVSISANHQSILASVAGRRSGKLYDKISVLEELGFHFIKAKTIDVLMVEDASAQIECKLIHSLKIGDHVTFFGEVMHAGISSPQDSLVFHKGKYWALEKSITKPDHELRDKIESLLEQYKRKN